MSQIYKNQTKLRLQADTGLSSTDHATLTAQVIKYIKPDATTGSFTASAGTAPYIYYDTVNTTDLDQSGIWTMWAYCTFTGGYVAAGDPKKVMVSVEGE
jgi:hypothetical protein